MPFIRCPACQARYQIPDVAGGKRAKCRKCGQVFKIPALKPVEEPLEELLPVGDLAALAGGEAIELEHSALNVPAASEGQGTAVAIPISDTVAYAVGPTGKQVAAAKGAYGAYFRSLAQSAAFPARVGDVITFAIVWVVLVVGEVVAPYALCLGTIVALIVQGWYMAFQLNVVLGAAAGEEELPTFTLTEGWWGGVFVPFVKMLSTYVVIWLPAIVLLLSAGAVQAFRAAAGPGGTVPPGGVWSLLGALSVQTLIIAGLLLLAGHFLWPILVLIVAVGGSVLGFVRLDLIGRTIARSIPAYLITVLAVYLSLGLTVGFRFLLHAAGSKASGFGGLPPTFVLGPLLLLVELYFTIIAMRAIGFYYHHFKHQFAWSWG